MPPSSSTPSPPDASAPDASAPGAPAAPLATRRAVRVLLAVVVVYGVLVAAHEGEFWPFSIYPMFSQGGNPWSRALVRDVSDASTFGTSAVPGAEASAWTSLDLDALPGAPFALRPNGVDAIDLANFVSKTERWDAPRVEGLRTMFRADALGGRRLLVLRVNGRIEDGDLVVVEAVPYALLAADTTLLNPTLPR